MANIIEMVFRGDVSGLQGSLGQAGSKLGAFGKVAAGAGAVAGAGFGVALANAMDVGQAQAKLDAQLGTTGGRSQAAGAAAGHLYASAYGESLDEVGQSVQMVMSGISGMSTASQADLEGITGKIMSVSGAFDQDMGGMVRAVDQMIRTGLAPNATAALDTITAGLRNVNDADDLLDTISEYSTQFRKLGLEGPQAVGLMSQALNAGARDADTVADALKEFSIRAIDGSKTTAAGFQAIGLNAEDMASKIAKGGPTASAALQVVMDKLRGMKDPVAQSQAAVALFGTKAEDLGQALYAINPSTAVDGLGQVAGAADDVNQKMQDTAQNKIKAVQRGFEMWTASLISTKGPLGDVGAMASAFGPQALSMVGSLGMVAVAFGPMTAAMGRAVVAGALWVAQTVAQGATALASMAVTAAAYVAQWIAMAAGAMARAVVMAASWLVAMGPVGWIIAIVIGLVALIIANWDTIKNFTVEAFTAIWAFLVGLWTMITAWVTSKIAGLVAFIIGAWNAFQATNSAIWTGIGNFIMGIWNNIIGFFAGIPGGIGRALGSLGSIIGGVFKGGLNAAIDFVNWGIDKINGLIGGINSVGGFVGLSIPMIPHVPRFHTGGEVPGPKGSELLAVLQAGETVIPAGARLGGGGGGGGSVTFNGNTSDALATVIMYLIRTGKIQIQGG